MHCFFVVSILSTRQWLAPGCFCSGDTSKLVLVTDCIYYYFYPIKTNENLLETSNC
ncbi:hypothetical protein PR003_g10790 [Phytophthora rubi]|uniref:Uncharacterized protein n=1 Tax=Phytophthora rubi TaxID=129364 RepID=A0A6A4F4S3_9STRA|nr:hypothetical protein PR001_g10658 [Phytophthora rubi]KAE9042772.1 hypothetical protein PR002_g3736 [Phytophthora rubi]KAE9339877.1 hypothetical protein PR003_g10790 [Phytophthora rubi]